MKTIILFCLIGMFSTIQAQTSEPKLPVGNIRLSFLIFPPFSPLLTLEMRTFDKLTIQLETNFINTHGVNLKYFINERMNGHFIFVGTAFIENDFLRKDKNITILPYAGYGYAHRFGKSNAWTFDSRLGIGRTTNADNNLILPVLKTGIGRTF
ncbi:MAG: hypothetical protein EAZ53_06735 [Bacteroidetes bacterium]|nr:MAG: hypothetical protein EAZ53_06735 [Bacteroidota bacterium]